MNRGTADESLQIVKTLLETVAGGLLLRALGWRVIDGFMDHLTLVSGYIHLVIFLHIELDCFTHESKLFYL